MKEIKIIHVENRLFAVFPSKKKLLYKMAEPSKFVDFVLRLRKNFPKFKLRCVLDEVLEKKLKAQLHLQGLFLQKGNGNGR